MLNVKIPEKPKSLIPINNPNISIKPQDYVWNKLIFDLKKTVSEIVGLTNSGKTINIEEPPENISEDLAFAAFPYAKQFKKSPNDIALDLASKLNKIKKKLPFISNIHQNGAYVNFDINADTFGQEVLKQIEKLNENY